MKKINLKIQIEQKDGKIMVILLKIMTILKNKEGLKDYQR